MFLINNFLKESFLIFKKRRWTFVFLFLSFVILFSLFGPIFKTHTFTKNQQNQIQYQSGKYDYKIKLPDYRYLPSKTTNSKNILNSLFSFESNKQSIGNYFQQIQKKPYWQKKRFDFLWVSNAAFVDYKISENQRRYYIIRAIIEDTLPNYKQKINNIVLNSGRLPKSNQNEIVVNTKFAKLNGLRLGQRIKLFDTDFTVVGFGNNGSNIYFDFPDLLKIKRQLQIDPNKFQDINLYKLSGLIFMKRSLFQNIINQKKITNFENQVYVKFDQKISKSDLTILNNHIDQTIKIIPEKTTSFFVDPASGLRGSYSNVEILIFSLVFIIGILFLINFIYLIVTGIVKNRLRTISLLSSAGYKIKTISINLFFYAFLTILVASITAFLFGLFLDNYLTNLYNKNSFLEIDFIPFDFFWFCFFVLIIPFFIGCFFFWFSYLKIKSSSTIWTSTHYQNQLLLRRTFLFRKLQKFLKRMPISSKIFTFFFLRDFSKKILVLLLLIILFLLSFALIFFRSSTQNYFNNQWKFYNKDVKSFTLYKRSVYFSKEGKIKSNLEWKTFEEFKKNAINLKNTKSLNIKNPTCLLAGVGTLNQDLVFKNRCLSNHYIDVNTIEDPKIKKYFLDYKLEKIFFNVSIYDQDKEFPALFLDLLANDGNEYKGFFMPRGWKKYFDLGDLKERLPDWKFKDNDLIGSTNTNIPYVLAGESFKKIINPLTKKPYQIGDEIEFKVVLHGYQSKQTLQAKIAAFVGNQNTANKTLFFDYSTLHSKRFNFPPLIINPNPDKPINTFIPFNILLTKNNKINYQRYLTIDLVFSRDFFNIETQKFNFAGLLLANIEAPEIEELGIFSKAYFALFEIYFSLILVLMILFVFLSLLMGIIFLFQDEHKIINKFRFIGYRLKELFISQFSIFLILLILSLIIGFAISLASFKIFENYFQTFNVFLYIGDIWIYLFWIFLIVFLLLVMYAFYRYHSLRQTLLPD